MADSTGIDAQTGKPLSDWEHVQQSIAKILTTPIGTRVMRRDFGSDIPNLVDAKMIPKNILLLYSAAALAIERWEPRFRMSAGNVARLSADGVIALNIYGIYYPRGHLGDYSIAETKSARVIVPTR